MLTLHKLIIAGLVALALGSLAGCGPSGQPKIELSETHIDLGTVVNGEVREFTVEVRNPGQQPLVIDAVTTSCGCTTATVAPETIGPGESGTLHVAYDSGAHGPEFNGPVERQIFIASNDPDQREVVLTLSVEVLLPVGP
ncbi:MAG: DUF1573 domain-containing protein [Anaerolineales bacterium]